jgi:hypothetical protein
MDTRAGMRIGDATRASVSLLAVGLPLLERSYEVLPVAARVREDALAAAVVTTLLCAIAGYATSRHSFRGLQVGWTSLLLFLGVVVAQFAVMDLIPRGERALYILGFGLFGLSAAAFLSIRQPPAERLPAPAVRYHGAR